MFPYLKTALKNLTRTPATESFPEAEPPKAAPLYRGRIFYDPTKCVNCGMCMRVCAPQAITRTINTLENGDQQITFTFDLTSCTFCATCADFCSKKTITLTDDYMIVGTKPEDFLVSGTFIKTKPAPKPQFTPEQIAAMKAAAEAKKAAAAAAAGNAPATPAASAAPAPAEKVPKVPAQTADEAKKE